MNQAFRAAGLVAATIAATQLSALLAVPGAVPVPVLAFAPGVLLAARLIQGPASWPAVVLAAWAGQLAWHHGWQSPQALGLATALGALHAAGVLAAGAWVDRYAGGVRYLQRPLDVTRFVAGVCFLVWVPVAIAATALQAGFGDLFRQAALAGWLADATGVFWVTSWLAAMYLEGARFRERVLAHPWEVVGMLAGLGTAFWVAFARGIEIQGLLVPLVVWAGFRTRTLGVLTLMVLMMVLFGFVTLHGAGPLALQNPIPLAIMLLQGRLVAQGTALLILLAVMEENERHVRSIEQQVAERTADARRAREEAEAANEAKSQFLASMSHEIRTPLTAMLASADLLTDGDAAARTDYAHLIRRNGEHLLALINDILDLSKIEAGELTVERIPCKLGPLFADMASLMRARAVEKGVAFDVELATPVPSLVESDPTRLRQIVFNLVGNAVKFTERGRVHVALRYEGGVLAVVVSDTGVGIPADQLPGLFQPFRQGDASMTRRFGGSGLGLAISRHLATALGGTIEVESQPGVGSTFTFRAPVVSLGDTGPITSLAVAPNAPAETNQTLGGRVLFAEDGPDNQLLIRVLLQKLGLEVLVVENGQLAVDAVSEQGPFDLVLMDMQMPVMDGYTATARLRELGYAGPIVALTAHAMAGERERCLAAGCDGYLSKPVDRAELRGLLAKILGQPSPR
ncbi:MAG: hypothetical protein JWM80_5821 [Cyanobacteria bacterium RYN_339]|nr:hypothetical protein [Cyanobacteria bacterium RYN_339]